MAKGFMEHFQCGGEPERHIATELCQRPGVEDNEKANRAIGYAGMVIRYVSDGSGTMDMIERATNQLKEVLK